MTLRRNIVLGALKEALKSLLILLQDDGHILLPLSRSLTSFPGAHSRESGRYGHGSNHLPTLLLLVALLLP